MFDLAPWDRFGRPHWGHGHAQRVDEGRHCGLFDRRDLNSRWARPRLTLLTPLTVALFARIASAHMPCPLWQLPFPYLSIACGAFGYDRGRQGSGLVRGWPVQAFRCRIGSQAGE
ncbi:hypothetical protein BCR44DRAFT_86423 [Catenaria anguillulae PL171]|uniref:Uncharacterized protein n=1 Tax=Catenaria anguillulae PL171 TaxID=765915 RepID=A0A1Y2HIA0_9FUNG|nr:hypothetical protein BCR44DRAFT_86423 [Catenaria anguillulae PL171]